MDNPIFCLSHNRTKRSSLYCGYYLICVASVRRQFPRVFGVPVVLVSSLVARSCLLWSLVVRSCLLWSLVVYSGAHPLHQTQGL